MVRRLTWLSVYTPADFSNEARDFLKLRPAMKISVHTVCRDADATLPRTISSFLTQDYPEKETIIVHGASSDGTLAAIYKTKHYSTKVASILLLRERREQDRTTMSLKAMPNSAYGNTRHSLSHMDSPKLSFDCHTDHDRRRGGLL